MELICLGLNHETAPVEVREHFAVAAEKQGERASEIIKLNAIEESVVLSTCNRMEIYVITEQVDYGAKVLHEHLASDHDAVEMEHLYQKSGDEARRHLFRLVSGLDSMVLGETEIFGQVKQAYQQALSSGTTKGILNKLFQKSFSVGKRVRTHTRIQMGQTSVGSVAVDLAEKIFGKLKGSHVMVIGAGEMSRQVAQSMLSRGAGDLTVTNRTNHRAVELAEELGGNAVPFEQWYKTLSMVDVIVSSTGASEPVLKAEQIEAVRRKRKFRPLFLIDIAVPRDIEPSVGDIEEVYLYDIDKLQQLADEAKVSRAEQVKICEQMIQEELYTTMKPLIVGTRGSALALVQAEMTEAALRAAFPEREIVRKVITTTGDRRTDVPLSQVAKSEGVLDKGVFTKELEVALENEGIDLAVHSMKDVPTVLADHFDIAGVLERAPVSDVLVCCQPGGLSALPQGAKVATSSVRRQRQLQWMRPDIKLVDIRGNVPTRLQKLRDNDGFDAIMLAEAGLVRLGYKLDEEIDGLFAEALDSADFYPAAGQGIVGFEIRKDDADARACAEAITHDASMTLCRAEREFLRLLDAGCHTPVGVRSWIEVDTLLMAGRVFDEQGNHEPVQSTASGSVELPEEVAAELYANLA